MGTRKLVFLDIDGTLAPPGGHVPPESAQAAIRAARENGHRFFLASGRNWDMSAPFLPFGFDGAVCSAGGYVVCGDRILYDHPMSDKTRDGIVSALREGGAVCVLEARDRAYMDAGAGEILFRTEGAGSEFERWKRELTDGFGARPLSEYDGGPVYKVVFLCKEARQLDRARELYEDRFSFRIQDFTDRIVLGEMISWDFDKGRGVLRICEHLGVPSEDTIGFGDSMNDWELLETVGISVCMGNGSAALKERADHVCPSVEEDGLAAAFLQLGLV